MHRLALVVPLCLSAALLAPQEELRFAPVAGQTVAITYEREGNLELTDMAFSIDGAEHGGMPQPELSLEIRERSVFLDRYEAVADGRVTRLVRGYEELSARRVESITADDGSESNESEAESELEGRSVVFRWDEDEQAYAPAFEDGEGDADLLEGLRARLDLHELLPDEPVEEGDAWAVPAGALGLVLAPGGDLKLMVEGRSISEGDDQLARSLEGDVRAVFRGAREEDGVEVLVIELEVEVEASLERELEDEGGEERQENEYELAGELLWQSAAGRFRSLELTGRVTSRIVTERLVEMGEREFQTQRTLELAGDVAYRLRAEGR